MLNNRQPPCAQLLKKSLGITDAGYRMNNLALKLLDIFSLLAVLNSVK